MVGYINEDAIVMDTDGCHSRIFRVRLGHCFLIGKRMLRNVQTDDLRVVLRRRGCDPLPKDIPNLTEPSHMVIKSFDSHAVLIAPGFDLQTAFPAILDQLKPFLIRTF